MKTPVIRPAQECAALIAENIRRYTVEKGFSVPRVKMSDGAIRRISGHTRLLPSSYIDQLVIEMQQLDWLMARYSDNEFLFLHFDIPKNWTKISAKRVCPDSVSDEDDTPDPDNWPLETLQEFVANNEIYVTKEEFEDRPALRNAVREFYKKS